MVFLLGCEKPKPEPLPERDLVDRVINLLLKDDSYQFVEFPELYFNTAKHVLAIDQENIILVDRLERRGFRTVSVSQINRQLSHRRIIKVMLEKEKCECEVRKTYYSTARPDEFIVTESIRCLNKQQVVP